MGYRAYWSMSQPRNPIPGEQYAAWIKANDGAHWAIDDKGNSVQDTSWYSMEDDIRELSTQHPVTVFCVCEESSDGDYKAEHYFRAGKLIFKAEEDRTMPEIPEWVLNGEAEPQPTSDAAFLVSLDGAADESARFAARLLDIFPWLGDEEEQSISGADTIENLQTLYDSLRAEAPQPEHRPSVLETIEAQRKAEIGREVVNQCPVCSENGGHVAGCDRSDIPF